MIEITHRIGKLGADVIDTTKQSWGVQEVEAYPDDDDYQEEIENDTH